MSPLFHTEAWVDCQLQPCDIVLTRSQSLLGRLVRFFTSHKGGKAAEVNHAGMITTAGHIRDVLVIESLLTTLEHNFWQKYAGSGIEVSIWRPRDLTEHQRQIILIRANRYLGFPYGGWKLIPHALDWAIGGKYFFRRLTVLSPYPICSWLVAYAFSAAGLDFGVPPRSASPDDIDDYVRNHPEKYLCVFPLQKLEKWEEGSKGPGEV